jgi:quercetin dioxygenase-like cupin family protein
MFTKNDDSGYRELLDGVAMKTLAYGEKTLLARFHLKKGAAIPIHDHIYEQTGYMVSGKMRFQIGDASFECTPGDTWCIPGNVAHGVAVSEDSVVVEVFSPVREDYLPGA